METLIILADGSWGVLTGATIFAVPENFRDEFDSLVDERGIFEALDNGNLDIIARIS